MNKAKEIEKEIKAKSKLKGFITPEYERYCVSNIPNTVLYVLGINVAGRTLPKRLIEDQIKGIKKVVVILVDSLGYKYFLKTIKKDRKNIFNELIRKGIFFPLTSTFPSSTPITLPSFSTGLTPQEHGIINSTFFMDEIKRLVNVKHFSTSDENPERLNKFGIRPKDLIESENIFEKLRSKKIKPYVLTFKEFINGDFDKLIYRGGKRTAYEKYDDFFRKITKILKERGKIYLFSYLYQIDTISHDYGPESSNVEKEMKKLSFFLKNFIDKVDSQTAKETLLIITSDHGHKTLSSKRKVYLRNYPELLKNLSVPPMGGTRCVFFDVKKSKVKEFKKYMEKRFKDIALTMETNKALKKGLFGRGKVNKKIYKRMGNVLLIPYKNYIFLSESKEDQEDLKGQHGGLSEDEMLVPFICLNLGKLKSKT